MAKKVKETRMESGVGRGGGFNVAKGRREERGEGKKNFLTLASLCLSSILSTLFNA